MIIGQFETKNMKLLIIYGTTEGQTRKIARFMADILKGMGHEVTLADASEDPPGPGLFDAVIIGASIHMHKYQAAVSHYITREASGLNRKSSAFFSVCLAVASDIEEEHHEAEQICSNFLFNAGWKPRMTIQIAGALKYTEYDFFKRLIMKMISKREGRSTDTSRDYEYTDWNAVTKFVTDFADKVVQSQGKSVVIQQ